MSVSLLSIQSEESKCIKNGNYKLFFKNGLLCITDGVNLITLDLSTSQILNWTPDTQGIYPVLPSGTAQTTLNLLLSSLINQIEDNKSDIAYKSDLDHTHSTNDITDLLTWFNNKKPELKGADGKDGVDGKDGKDGKDGTNGTNGQDGKSAFELWQLDLYGNIEPVNIIHQGQYIDPSGFGNKSNVVLLSLRDEYVKRLNLYMKETGKNALNIEDEANAILATINYGMSQEEINSITQQYNDKLAEITESMTQEEKQAIRDEASAILATIDYGMTQEEIATIQNQYAAKKAEWINWQQSKNYEYSLIYKEISGYPGDNPTEYELRYYTYRLWTSGELDFVPEAQQAQTTADRAEETAKKAKKLGIAGTVLGAIGTVFGIGNTAAEVVSYSSLQAQITSLAADVLALQGNDVIEDLSDFDEVINDFHEITGDGSIWDKIGNFFKEIWSNITNLNTGYEQVETVMVEGGSLLDEVSAFALGVRGRASPETLSLKTRDIEVQPITINNNFIKWYLQQYPSMNGLLTAIKTTFESNVYDYSGKDSSLRILYMMCGELLDRIDLIPDYDERILSLENLIEYKENNVVEEEEEDVHEFHPEITFKNVETIKKSFNNEIKTIAYIEDINNLLTNKADNSMLITLAERVATVEFGKASINHNHDSVYSPINHNHDTLYASINHLHISEYASINHNHDTAYSAINHNHDTSYASINHTHNNYIKTLFNNFDEDPSNNVFFESWFPQGYDTFLKLEERTKDNSYSDTTTLKPQYLEFSHNDYSNNTQKFATYGVDGIEFTNGETIQQGTIDAKIAAAINNAKTAILQQIYPVGAIYTSRSNTNPATVLGFGSWTNIQNQFMYCIPTTSAHSTGGSSTHTHTTGSHTLTIDEIPSHRHSPLYYGSFGVVNGKATSGGAWDTLGITSTEQHGQTGDTGGGQAHSHGDTGSASSMPPYITVYAWYRAS